MNKSPSLKQRIESAKKELKNYPDWVKNNSYFQGGVTSEYKEYIQKPSPRIQEGQEFSNNPERTT